MVIDVIVRGYLIFTRFPQYFKNIHYFLTIFHLQVYRHPSCLVKHRWEHSPHWREASKLMLSKHQQVQLLEVSTEIRLLPSFHHRLFSGSIMIEFVRNSDEMGCNPGNIYCAYMHLFSCIYSLLLIVDDG